MVGELKFEYYYLLNKVEFMIRFWKIHNNRCCHIILKSKHHD
jgi:hypothetical protein